jgi:ABC-type sugar transport system substrate-binding protein
VRTFSNLILSWRCLVCSVLAAMLLPAGTLIGAPMRIVYLTPASEGNPFWTEVFEYMDKAAADLGIVFEHKDLGTVDRYTMNDVAKKLMTGPDKPSALILAVAYGNTIPLIELAELYHIPVVIHGYLFPQELMRIGKTPRNHYKYWIASLEQDERMKSRLAAISLLKKTMESIRRPPEAKIRVLGLSGVSRWRGQSLRDEGFAEALALFPQMEMVQSIQVPWTADKARDLTKKLLDRHKDVSAIWCATDLIAEGAGRAATEKGYVVGKSMFLSGIDLSRNGLDLILKDKLVATSSVPAPFFGLMLVMLHDYLKGHDFQPDFGTLWSPEVILADESNALPLKQALSSFKRVDFKRYSKVLQSEKFSYEKRFYSDFHRMLRQPTAQGE